MLYNQSLRAMVCSLRSAPVIHRAIRSTYSSYVTKLSPKVSQRLPDSPPLVPSHSQHPVCSFHPLRDYSTSVRGHSPSHDSTGHSHEAGHEGTAARGDAGLSHADRASDRQPEGTTVDHGEVEKFAKLANDWWRLDGPFQPLHIMNPVRVSYLRLALCTHFDLDPMAPRPLQGLRVLDVGCGGGLLSESMARLGANVTGIDAAAEGLAIAQYHAQQDSVTRDIDYRNITAEDLVQTEGASFDAVLALEVIEHVSDTHQFLSSCASLVKPGGALAVSTINRTPKSFSMAILGAEYLLRWVPAGTHEWNRFIKPSELTASLESIGTHVQEVTGMVYNPLTQKWSMSPDTSVNYIALAIRPAAEASL